MLKHMLIARAVHGDKPMDLEAHARFSCQMGNFSNRMSLGFGSIISRLSGVFYRN